MTATASSYEGFDAVCNPEAEFLGFNDFNWIEGRFITAFEVQRELP
jgi:hypothetical protein